MTETPALSLGAPMDVAPTAPVAAARAWTLALALLGAACLVAQGFLAFRLPALDLELWSLGRALTGRAWSDDWVALVHAPLHPAAQSLLLRLDAANGWDLGLAHHRLITAPVLALAAVLLARNVGRFATREAGLAAGALFAFGPFVATFGASATNYVLEASLGVIALDRFVAVADHRRFAVPLAAVIVPLALGTGFMTASIIGPALVVLAVVLVRRGERGLLARVVGAVALAGSPLWWRMARAGVAYLQTVGFFTFGASDSVLGGHVTLPRASDPGVLLSLLSSMTFGLDSSWALIALAVVACVRVRWLVVPAALLAAFEALNEWIFFVPENFMVAVPIVATLAAVGLHALLRSLAPAVRAAGWVLLVGGGLTHAWVGSRPGFVDRYLDGLDEREEARVLADRHAASGTVLFYGAETNAELVAFVLCEPVAPMLECLRVTIRGPGGPAGSPVRLQEALFGDRHFVWLEGQDPSSLEAELARVGIPGASVTVLRGSEGRGAVRDRLDVLLATRCHERDWYGGFTALACD